MMDIIFIKRLLTDLILPPGLVLVLLLAGWLIGRRNRRAGSVIAMAGMLVLWIASTPLVADRFARSTEKFAALDLTNLPEAQAIVILGGGLRLAAPEYRQDAPRAAALERLAYGARLARASRLPVIVSGGIVFAGEPEAVVMKRFFETDFGIPVLLAETDSRDTHGNAQFTARLLAPLGIRRILLVTSSLHMERSMAEFRAARLYPIAAPAGMVTSEKTGVMALVPDMQSLIWTRAALHERLGNLVQRLRG